MASLSRIFFFFNDTATTEIYTLSLHDALPICRWPRSGGRTPRPRPPQPARGRWARRSAGRSTGPPPSGDRKSTRLNSSHSQISYAVFCLEKKNKRNHSSDLALDTANDRVKRAL